MVFVLTVLKCSYTSMFVWPSALWPSPFVGRYTLSSHSHACSGSCNHRGSS